jgi:molybdate transport system regulatory protein
MAKLFLRLPVGEGAFGPGKARLLELVEQTGSIRAAAGAMKLSYRRAWLLLAETERLFGAPVLERRTGGKSGGGAALTRLGRDVVKHYRAAEKHAGRAVHADIAALAKLAKS